MNKEDDVFMRCSECNYIQCIGNTKIFTGEYITHCTRCCHKLIIDEDMKINKIDIEYFNSKVENIENELKSLKKIVNNSRKKEAYKQIQIRDDCPVFLEGEIKNGDGYWRNGCKYYYYFTSPFCFYWKTKDASIRYANNSAIYKLLQIIWRYYGGQPSKEDWNDKNIDKYYIYQYSDENCFDWGRTHGHVINAIYMLKQPNIPDIEEKMGKQNMEWFIQ